MKVEKDTPDLARRDLLKKAGLAAGAAGVAAVAATGNAEAAQTVDAPASSGYAETEHVRTFYELAKF